MTHLTSSTAIKIKALTGIPDIRPGDDLSEQILSALVINLDCK